MSGGRRPRVLENRSQRSGLRPTAIGDPMTVFVAVSMTDIVPPVRFATYARVPSGDIAMSTGVPVRTNSKNFGAASPFNRMQPCVRGVG